MSEKKTRDLPPAITAAAISPAPKAAPPPFPQPEPPAFTEETGADPGLTIDELLLSLDPPDPNNIQPFVDTFASEGQGTLNDLATHLRQESPQMVQTEISKENIRALEHPPTDRPGAPLSSAPPPPPRAPETPDPPGAPQLDLPGLPREPAREFAARARATGEWHDSLERDDLRADQEADAEVLETLAIHWINTLDQLGTAAGVGRVQLQRMLNELARHLLACGFDSDIPKVLLTLEQVLSLMGAARNLSRNVSEVSGFDFERLALTFAHWLRQAPPPAIAKQREGSRDYVTPGPAPERPRSHKAAAPPAGDVANVTPKVAAVLKAPPPPKAAKPPAAAPGNSAQITKSGAGRPGLPADVKAQRERDKQKAAEQKAAGQKAKADEKARLLRLKELEREMAKLNKATK